MVYEGAHSIYNIKTMIQGQGHVILVRVKVILSAIVRTKVYELSEIQFMSMPIQLFTIAQ